MELQNLQIPMFLSLILIPLFLLFIQYLRNGGNRQTASSHAGFKSYPLLGILPGVIGNHHRFLDWITEVLTNSPNNTITVQIMGIIFTADPANVEHVLKTCFANYGKGDYRINTLKDFLGDSILNSDGEDWKWQRKVTSYEFSKRSLRNVIIKIMQDEIVDGLLPFLKNVARKGESFDLQDVFERFGFDVVSKMVFSEDPCSLGEEGMHTKSAATRFMRAFDEAQNLAVGRFREVPQLIWMLKRLLNIGSEKKLKKSISIVRAYAMEIVQKREGSPLGEYTDLLSRLASIKDSSQEFLVDVIMGFILAGRETTSTALVWFFWVLSQRPDVREKIITEIQMVRTSTKISATTFSYDHLCNMHYLHAAITESMRLFPPAPTDSVICRNDDILPDGTVVRKGWLVAYSAYAMGRMEDIWGIDCKEYKPERWLANGIFKPESQFRYPVFHAGPRICLGKEMAYMQMKSVVACILEHFEVLVLDTESIPQQFVSATMKMKGGLPVKVKEKEHHQ